jgi:hypothetical protein
MEQTAETTEERKSLIGKRKITWADGTAEPQQSNLAISIPRHKNLVKNLLLSLSLCLSLSLSLSIYLSISLSLSILFFRLSLSISFFLSLFQILDLSSFVTDMFSILSS